VVYGDASQFVDAIRRVYRRDGGERSEPLREYVHDFKESANDLKIDCSRTREFSFDNPAAEMSTVADSNIQGN